MNRRTLLTGAVAAGAAALVPLGAAEAADANRAPYGSGPLGDWTAYTPMLSTPAFFQAAKNNNGVMLIGDSIAKANAFTLATRIGADHGLTTAVNAWPSRPTEPAVDWLEQNASLIPDRGVVMACGSNDIFNPKLWYQHVNRALDAAAGKPVYWITTYVDRWSLGAPWRAADMRNSAWINQQIYSIANVRPELVVVDWHAWLSYGPNESRIDSHLTDGVHCTPVGASAWCDLLQLRMGL